ncbi:MAG: hypothetical protein NVV74_02465 [Magnetospirillum sp.]|nr:hypothetical protein [Magnetospirillum sp.]
MATINGTSGNDTLSGTDGRDSIFALGGNDLIFGSAGSDTLDGGEGSDTVNYSRLNGIDLHLGDNWVSKSAGGTDTLVSIGNAVGTPGSDRMEGNANDNHLQAGAGNDLLAGGAGNDILDGGEGSDKVRYYNSPAGVTVDLAAGTASDGFGTTDRIISIGLASGSPFDDVISGTSDVNTLEGGAGNDRLFGRNGDDVLMGGAGDDLLDGGNGSDTVSYISEPGGITVDLAGGWAIDSFGNHDTIVSCGLATAAPYGADTLLGNDNANTLVGFGHGDTLTGRGGADTFGTGSWDWWGNIVTDFQHGQDKLEIDLGGIPINRTAGALDPAYFTTGTPNTTHWTITYDRASGVVGFDIDGSGSDGVISVMTLTNHPEPERVGYPDRLSRDAGGSA